MVTQVTAIRVDRALFGFEPVLGLLDPGQSIPLMARARQFVVVRRVFNRVPIIGCGAQTVVLKISETRLLFRLALDPREGAHRSAGRQPRPF